jgi:hypothetical protein
MRRILAIVAAATLLTALVAGSTAASTSRLVDAHALVALEGVPVGWIDSHLTTPTDGNPAPGMIEFTPLANSGLPAWTAIVKVAAFYWSDYDPDLGGSFPGAWAPSMQCAWEGPGDYACADLQVWMLDGGAFKGQSDWFVTAPEENGSQTWYQVVKGNIEVQVP